jgi:hypothetical protein
MASRTEHLGIKIEREFEKEIQEKADKKGLTKSAYARMKLKEAV